MAQYNINSASNGLHPHSYNPLSVASLDFGELVCTRFIECEKSDKWNSVKANGSLRLAAVDFPAYGRAYIKSAAFFVPTYQILQNVDGFRSNMLSDKGQSCVMPHILSDYVNECLAGSPNSTNVWSGTNLANLPSIDTYDFITIEENTGDVTQWHCWKLTAKGRRFYKFFKMLGFDWATYTTDTQFSHQPVPFNVNALTILSFAKVWTDYFCNIHMYNSNVITHLLRAVKDGHDYSILGVPAYTASTGLLSKGAVGTIFDICQLPYESNMYTDAWNTENSPTGVLNSQSLSPHNVLSPVLPSNYYGSGGLDVQPQIHQTVHASDLSDIWPNHDQLVSLNQLGINALGALWDFVRRNNLFGSESAKQAFARAGIKGNDYNSYFVAKLFEDSQQIDFSAVMSNSNTISGNNGSALGAYAGVGLGSMNFDYNYECSDYGIILNLNWIQFNTLQFHGFDPAVLRMHAFDWFTAVWDGKAQRAIPMIEIGDSKKPLDPSRDNNDTNVFGFIGIYDEYRRMRDVVLGDFCNGFAKNFLFGRDLSAIRENIVVHLQPQIANVQYVERFGNSPDIRVPFQFDSSNGDRFYLQFIWDISSERPMLSGADTLMLNGSGDLSVSTDSSNMS